MFQTSSSEHFTSLVVIVKSLMSGLHLALHKSEAFRLQIDEYDKELKQVVSWLITELTTDK